jgi:hypothetical protein
VGRITNLRSALYVIGVIAVGSLVYLALDAGLDAPGSNLWLVAADLIVGIAFVLAGVLAPGPVLMRGLVAFVGALWLFGS